MHSHSALQNSRLFLFLLQIGRSLQDIASSWVYYRFWARSNQHLGRPCVAVLFGCWCTRCYLLATHLVISPMRWSCWSLFDGHRVKPASNKVGHPYHAAVFSYRPYTKLYGLTLMKKLCLPRCVYQYTVWILGGGTGFLVEREPHNGLNDN